MAIKKRSISTEKPIDVPEDDGKLRIVAKPKKPLPDSGFLDAYLGDVKQDRVSISFTGMIAGDVGVSTDDAFNIKDLVIAMRTPLDPNNPQEARYRNRVRNRGTAITAFCITCRGGRKAVTECGDTECPLWAFRFGSDPFYGHAKKK